MRAPRALPAGVAAVAAATLAVGLSGCGAAGPRPQTALSAFLSAWSRGDWSAMRGEVADPPADFTAVNSQTFAALGVSRATFTAGPLPRPRDGRTTATVTARYAIAHAGTWSPTSTVHLVKAHGRWRVQWTPATIDRSLQAGEKIAVSAQWPARAPILGAGGAPLTRSGSQVVVGVVGSGIKNASAVRTDLLAAGAPSAAVTRALAAARSAPQDFEPVFTVSAARFAALKAKPGPENVYAVAGTTFHAGSQTSAITAQLGTHLIGTLGPITAQQLKSLGSPYDASSVIGQSGLEASEERRLAGTPSIHVDVDDAGGNPLTRLATYPGRPGRSVRTSIDPRVQRAAEAAMATAARPNVAMVAMRASTGQVLAVVSDPVSTYDTALEGAYPPGSTFKVLTSTALFTKGQSPASPASCPSTISVDGESFHNAGNEAPTPTITQAFIESCNTAFIGLAVDHLSPADFPAAAARYGLQSSPHLGVPAFDANVLKPTSQTQLAADAIGQGNVTFSPLGMATVAAAIASGSARPPTLVQGTGGGPPRTLPAAVVDGLRPMMLGVVQSGTAAGTGLPSGTYAKTGTAEYGPVNDLKIDGWLMGYDRDIAFAIVTHDTGGADGGPVDGPIIARFLNALGSSA